MRIPLILSACAVFWSFFIVACAQGQQDEQTSTNGDIAVDEAFINLTFERPVDLQHAGDDRLFVVEQRGIISQFKNDQAVNRKTIFLDIEDRVDDGGNEEGLLGLAFHPDFKNNGYFYVNYTASRPDRTVISRFKVSESDPNQADVLTEQILLEFEQPYSNHNGGQLAFGPDGYLYIAVGDGGSGGDPQGHGQNLKTLLGTILRIDINKSENNRAYAIPADNPYAGNSQGYRPEIWAYGLRNPWRMSFDTVTNQLWAADVGQNKWEEINIIEKGGNYGWNHMEGKHCFEPRNNCRTEGLKLPVWEYNHDAGVSITGGYVYRGKLLPQLQGRYVYADFVSSQLWTLTPTKGTDFSNESLLKLSFPIASFGVDSQGELYLCGFDGKIYKFVLAQK